MRPLRTDREIRSEPGKRSGRMRSSAAPTSKRGRRLGCVILLIGPLLTSRQPGRDLPAEDTQVGGTRTITPARSGSQRHFGPHSRIRGGASARQIVVPEEAGSDRPPRPPRLAEQHEGLRIGPHRKHLCLCDRGRQGHVADRPHVRPAEHHQQVDGRGPSTDPGDRLERRLGSVVVEICQRLELEGAVEDGRGQRSRVARLLAAEPDREQLAIGEAKKRLGRQRVGRGLEAVEGGARRSERDLLLEDDVYQGPEAGRPVPKRRRAMSRDDRREVGVPRGELRDGRLEAALFERPDQATVPLSPKPALGSGSNDRPSAPRSQARAFSPRDGRW
jgi:hypothetical protein